MSNKASENYLDELLYSLNGNGTSPQPEPKKPEETKEPVFDAPETSDDDFLKSFEEEMGFSDDDFLAEFDADLGITHDGGKRDMGSYDPDDDLFAELDMALSESRQTDSHDDINDLFNEIDESEPFVAPDAPAPEAVSPESVSPKEVSPEKVSPEVAESEASAPDTISIESGAAESQDAATQTEDALPEIQMPEELFEEGDLNSKETEFQQVEPEELPLTEAGEPDLAGVSADDLLDMLSETDGMEGIGDLLSKDEAGTAVDTEDAIGAFADKEMNPQDGEENKGIEEEEPEDGKKKKKRKKKEKKKKDSEQDTPKADNFFTRLLKKLFESEEDLIEDEAAGVLPMDGPGVEELSEENMALLRELEGADAANADKEEDGKKKKKEKKQKKEKPKKEKKEKPKKEKKPKAPKEPKEKGKPLPKKPVIFITLLGVSIGVMVMVATNLSGYTVPFSQAKSLFNTGASDPANYVAAFEKIDGMKIKKGDMEFYNRALIMAEVSSEYEHYLVFKNANEQNMSNSMQVEAFDALVCAAGRYQANIEGASEYDCVTELENLGALISDALKTDYNMTLEDAYEIYGARTRKAYTILIYQKLKELGLY
ncbi:MAG: hypothetical protein E7282_02510 [Lachnospiraceae bacterium]|nr:hypothetical protein [Lachnospiraceae bacterium]